MVLVNIKLIVKTLTTGSHYLVRKITFNTLMYVFLVIIDLSFYHPLVIAKGEPKRLVI